MNPADIIKGISYLAVATNHDLSEERLTIYVHQLSDLKNPTLFAQAVDVLVKASSFMPTVAEIRAAYTELLRQYRPANALNAGAESGWEHAAGGYDDCLGACNRKHRLDVLMARNGYCPDCVPIETVTSRMPTLALRTV